MEKLIHKHSFSLESGTVLPLLEVAYHTYGTLNADRSNVVWVFHALTGNAEVADWWQGVFGEGKVLDPSRDFIICANMLGSCYGSSSPISENPVTGTPFYGNFPRLITVKDMVKAHRVLAQQLGIQKIKLGIGGSMGGQQLLEWAVQEPERFRTIIPIATNAKHSPWGIAFNESQRMTLEADPTLWYASPLAGRAGLRAARATALLSYRNYETYALKQSDKQESLEDFKAKSYQNYQGEKLVQRFHAQSYYILSKSMDSHDVGRGRNGIEEALGRIQSKTLVIGISSDQLFPTEEQLTIARNIPDAQFFQIDSIYGHDGFLVEHQKLNHHILNFLQQGRHRALRLGHNWISA